MMNYADIEKSVLEKIKVFPAWRGYSDPGNKVSEYDAHASFGEKFVYSVTTMKNSLTDEQYNSLYRDGDIIPAAKNKIIELEKDIKTELTKLFDLNRGHVSPVMLDRFVNDFILKNKARLFITVPDMWFPKGES